MCDKTNGKQWSSMSQRNKIFQTLATHTILVSRISSLLTKQNITISCFTWHLLCNISVLFVVPFMDQFKCLDTIQSSGDLEKRGGKEVKKASGDVSTTH